jgi:glucose-6-phosphate-specific signal transduction histidine kinase
MGKEAVEDVSNGIMYVLLVFYVAILFAALWERNYWRALYFLGAIVISIAVLGMTYGRQT